MRTAKLRSRITPRRRSARRIARTALANDRALFWRLSDPRSGGIPAIGGNSRSSAQLQDSRHLLAIMEARRQATLPRPPTAGLAAARTRPGASGSDPDRSLA